MLEVFLTVLRMNAYASLVIVAVIAARFLLRRFPKWYSYVLWSVVGLRLVCPFSVRAPFGVMNLLQKAVKSGAAPDVKTGEAAAYAVAEKLAPVVTPGVEVVTHAASQTAVETAVGAFSSDAGASAQTAVEMLPERVADLQGITADVAHHAGETALRLGRELNGRRLTVVIIFTIVWLVGATVIAALALQKSRRLHRIAQSARRCGIVCESSEIETPFVLGAFRPKIMLPEGLGEREREMIIRHEMTHIRRGDNIIKAFAFALLTVHWFDPLVWIAFELMTRDMEASCDERALRDASGEARRIYSLALVAFARRSGTVNSPAPTAAFGRSEVKMRIKRILTNKKTSPLLAVPVFALCLMLTVACVPNAAAPAGSGTAPAAVSTSDIYEFPDVIGEYETTYNAGNTARTANILRAAELIDGTVLLPNEEFSFVEAVGEVSEENGFAVAHGYRAEEMSVSGCNVGVNQTATTLYNAVMRARLETVECHHSYYPTMYNCGGENIYGNDAIALPDCDLRFLNIRPEPVKIDFTYGDGSIRCVIKGVKNEYTYDYKYAETGTSGFGVIYQPAIEGATREDGEAGREISVYRVKYKDGDEVERELYETRTYYPLPEVIYTNDLPAGAQYDVEYSEPFTGSNTPVPVTTQSINVAEYATGSIAELIKGVPLPAAGTCIAALNGPKGQPLGHDSDIVYEGYVPQMDMMLLLYKDMSKQDIDAYVETLKNSGFTYSSGAEEPESAFVLYNAPKDGVGIQGQDYGNNKWQITIFRQGDGCYGLMEYVPKG